MEDHPLRIWMRDNQIGVTALQRLIGVRSPATIYRYLDGRNVPRKQHMAKIMEVTKGEIGPDDFY